MPRLLISSSMALLLLLAGGIGEALGQCLLANPSFELAGSGGTIFAGWNQFSSVGVTTSVTHGSKAARVTGPGLGGWDVSGYWQNLSTVPGDRWLASVRVSHPVLKPLTGQSRAILNIEWRNASGSLISYESHTAADATTPAGEYRLVTVQSQPAPSGAVSARLLLGVLQSPTDPRPDVFYDHATFEKAGPPTIDDLQWGEFPGGRTISFSGRTWRVKGPGYYGPGPSLFSDATNSVWVDGSNRLHLTIRYADGSWHSSEVALVEPLGYGDYIFTTVGRLDTLDPGAVLGLFIYEYRRCYDPAALWWNPHNECDVEFSRWGIPGNNVGQFVTQPFDYPGSMSRFGASFTAGEITSHAFRWKSDRIEYRSWRGGPQDESTSPVIHAWTYTGPHIPRPDQPRVHINLWQYVPPSGADQEVILASFTFVAEGSVATSVPPRIAVRSTARPNPFRARTTIGFTMPQAGDAAITIFDASGRVVRALSWGHYAAGAHEVDWDGMTDGGRRAASGLYFVQWRSGAAVETQRLILLN